MEILVFERRHVNGSVARVFAETEGAGYRAEAMPAFGPESAAEWPYVDTIDEAQADADRMAHPGCEGQGCGRWTPVVGRARPPE